MVDQLPNYAVVDSGGGLLVPASKAMRNCRVEPTGDAAVDADVVDMFEGWTDAAQRFVETQSGTLLTQRTVTISFEAFPPDGGPLQLPVAPIQSVTGITYRDADGVSQSLTGFGTWLAKRPPLIGRPSAGWPGTACDGMAAVTITAVAGWPGGAGAPPQAQQAIELIVAYWNGFRGDGKDPNTLAAIPGTAGVPAGAERLINQLRRKGYR